MAQLPFSVICGTPNPTPATCPAGFHTTVDADGSGNGILYGDTRAFTPCAAAVVDTYLPASTRIPAWNPHNVANPPFNDAPIDASCVPSPFPLPPHCWGWGGGSDYLRTTYYSFANTLLQIADTLNEFGQFDDRFLSVTVDYDVRLQRRYTQREVVYPEVDGPGGFGVYDFTTIFSDTCTDLENTDVTTHVTDFSRGGTVNVRFSTIGGWNSEAFVDGQHSPLSTGANQNYSWFFAEWQNSQYRAPQGPNAVPWGSFFTWNTHGPPGARGEWHSVYLFGRETRTITNVRFTLTTAWRQFHCEPDGGGGGGPPCNCNDDCPPCQGTGAVPSGGCATICANGTISDTPAPPWEIRDGANNQVASFGNENGWSVTHPTPCSLRVCAPCLTPAQLAAGNYQGPYTASVGTGATCMCEGAPKNKNYTASFTVYADVICPTEPPPTPGHSVSYDVSSSHRHVRAYSTLNDDNSPGPVKVGLAANVMPLDWHDIETDIVADRFCIRWDRRSLGSDLYGLAELAGELFLYHSIDEGNTWEKLFKVDNGSRPCLLLSKDGRRFCFWYSGGQIWQKVYDGGWQVEKQGADETETKIIFDVAAGDDFSVDEWVGHHSELLQPAFYSLNLPTKHPTGFVAKDGRRFYFFNSGGVVSYYVLDGAGNSIWDTRQIAIGPVDDDQISVDETVAEDMNWYVTVAFRSEGKIKTMSSKDGVVFA